MNRQLIVRTAQGYYEAAMGKNTDGEVYLMAEKLCCMEQALNHTENALAVSLRMLNEILIWNDQDDDNILDIELRNKISNFIDNFNIEL
jgi:Ser/Thr protein kinase RdoA (MazF antagonist)